MWGIEKDKYLCILEARKLVFAHGYLFKKHIFEDFVKHIKKK